MKATRRALLWLLFLGVTATAAHAQTFTGGLRGVVADANGVIPGVTVTLTNESTGVSRDTVTNDVGQYNFPAVPPGTYSVKTSLTGYKSFERTGVRVGTQQFLTLDVNLEVGTLQETVTVTGEAPLIDTATASTGGTLDRTQLEALPSPGRNAFLIGVTVPTVNPVGDPQFNRQQDQTNASLVSLGGGGVRANNYLLDGVPITEMRGRAIANPTIEAIEEVKVQVHTYDAEMGRTGGGVFNVTAKSGTNQYHGSGFFQTRPVWGQSLNFFDDKAGETKESSGVADSYYRLYGGGIGGPVLRNRTFFWAATEGYRSLTTRGLQYVWPTAAQRNGDFSRTTRDGVPVRLFNPWCRGLTAPSPQCPATGTGSLATGGEFTNAIIPRTHPAANPAGFNIINAWPTETVSGEAIGANEDGNPNVGDTARLVDQADMVTLKVDHRFTDNWSLSGFYLYNKTDEPGSGIMPAPFQYIENQAEFFPTLRRRPHVVAINNTNVLNDSTVMTLRFGWTTWKDTTDTAVFEPGLGSLGFSSNYVNALSAAGQSNFPELTFDDIDDVGGWGGDNVRWNSPYSINGTLTKLLGSHSIKIGADLRKMSLQTTTETSDNTGFRFLGGSFDFNRLFTSQAGTNIGGHDFASLLLGLPASGEVPFNDGFGEWFTRYAGAYIQDDWRMNSKLTLNYGVRLEHESGLREIENRQTVAFDQEAVNPIDALVPKTGLLAGRTLRGGLVFAGVDGAPEEQGNLPAVTVAPRVGATYAINPKTVIHGGYGTFYAPWQYNTANHGQIGFARRTSLVQSSPESEAPITTLDNPFPAGLQEPIGSSLGLLTGVGGNINYIDQEKGAPVVHQYSVDVQRELPGEMAITIGYQGATGRDLGFAGTNNVGLNINQIDPEVARRVFPAPGGGWNAAALRAQVPNPFFGVAGAGELGTRATVPAGQLLRPFPQFGDVNVFERTEGGRRQYNAVALVLDKRLGRSPWGGRYSYTWSRLEDNQFGESSAYQTRTAVPQNVYDLDAEYGISNFDSPHRIILAPIVRLGRQGDRALLTGGWSASAVVELVSGSPLNAVMSAGASDANLGLLGGRQRPNVVGEPETSGSDEERVSSGENPDGRWFDAGAFANPGAGTFGSAPRTDGSARYQFRKNVDLVITKDTRFAGSQSAQIRFEILNLTNTAKFNGSSAGNAVDAASFGRITSQRGFMRIWQLSFRYAF